MPRRKRDPNCKYCFSCGQLLDLTQFLSLPSYEESRYEEEFTEKEYWEVTKGRMSRCISCYEKERFTGPASEADAEEWRRRVDAWDGPTGQPFRDYMQWPDVEKAARDEIDAAMSEWLRQDKENRRCWRWVDRLFLTVGFAYGMLALIAAAGGAWEPVDLWLFPLVLLPAWFVAYLPYRLLRDRAVKKVVGPRPVRAVPRRPPLADIVPRPVPPTGPIGMTPDRWKLLCSFFEHACAYCGRRMEYHEFVIEHVIPRSRGGRDSIDNVVPACGDCNKAKFRRTGEEYVSELEASGRAVNPRWYAWLSTTTASGVRFLCPDPPA